MSPAGLLAGLLGRLGRLVGRRPGAVLLFLVAVTAAAAAPAWRTLRGIDCNLLNVLTQGLPRAGAYQRIGRDFGIIDQHFLLVEAASAADAPSARQLADRLAEGLSAEPELVRSARCRFPLDFFRDHAWLYLDEAGARELAARLSDAGMAEAMARNAELLAAGPQLEARVKADPLGLAELIKKLAAGRTGRLPLDGDGYVVRGGGRLVLVLAMPTRSAGDREFTRRLLSRTREIIERERAALPGSGRLQVEIGGAYASIELHTRLMVRGLELSAASSFVIILLMFAFSYRRPITLFLVGAPLIFPVVWTLAAAPVMLGGRISLLGAAFACVLLGLGIDFAVHLYNRYALERAAGRSTAEAASLCLTATGEGIVVGALTTVAAFAGMALTPFRGFTEFGVLAAAGVFLTMIALLLAVPAALVLLDRWRGEDRATPRPVSFGMDGLSRAVGRFPTLMVAAGFLALGGGAAALFADPQHPGLRFESSMEAIGPPHSVDTVDQVNRRAGISLGEVSVIVRGSSAAEALTRTAELARRAEALVRAGRLAGAQSIVDLAPPPAEQERSLARARALPLADFSARLSRAATTAGFQPGAFAEFAGRVEDLRGKILRAEPLDVERLPDPAVAELAAFLFRAPDAGCREYQTHSRLVLAGQPAASAGYDALAAELGVAPADMTSQLLVTLELKDKVQADLAWVSLIVGGVVLLMLWLALRRPVYIALALSPVILGGAGMVVFMKLTGIDLNYINVLAFPILIGIGVDNAVHLIIRARQPGGVRGAVTETGRALALCSLTTIWGFFSLYQPLLSPPHWGMRSLGLLVAVGMSCALVVSLTFVPAALLLLNRRGGKA